jgi:hypothetical protein
MNATTMLQVVANLIAIPVERLDLTGSQAYRNGYALDMDVGHDVDIMVNDQDASFRSNMAALLAAYPLLVASLEDKGYGMNCIYLDVCGFNVNLIDLNPDDFHAWQHATAMVKAGWVVDGMETWEKEARVAFFKATRNSYLSGLVAGRQGR